MSASVRRIAYALGAVAAVLLALVAFDSLTSSTADAAVTNPVVRSKYFSGATTVSCPSGWAATGGGVGADIQSSMYVARSEPVKNSAGKPVAWKGDLRQRVGGGAASGTVYVVCAP
ncbi:hypothetical protein [Streptomyces sp. NPDC005890]|uniref:hypothetical protein n=1 Tax=Streptomyces sp. NPDC005890 TaxID=3154568 RepID=UPI0034042710